jgi:hypothetical protein
VRQWIGVPVKILCNQHLLGEYHEHFMIKGLLKKHQSLDGYFRSNLIEPLSFQQRFFQLKQEMQIRGYHTKDLFFEAELLAYLGHARFLKVNKKKTIIDLFTRCENCREKAFQQGYIGAADFYSFALTNSGSLKYEL